MVARATGGVQNGGYVVRQSYAGWTRPSNGVSGDDMYQSLTTTTIPGGTMGPSSKLVIISDWDYNASANRKFLAVDFGVTNISAVDINNLPTLQMGKILIEVQNLGSLSTQKTMNGSSYGISANPRISSAIDTANDVIITFKGRWNVAGVSTESIILLGYSIVHYPGV